MPQKIDNSIEAKELARQIAGQRCKYYGYKNLGVADYGAQQFYCDRGMYTLEVGQSHLFDQQFYSFKADDEVRFCKLIRAENARDDQHRECGEQIGYLSRTRAGQNAL